MKTLSYKFKIIILVVAFVVFAVGMFTFGYDIMATRNASLSDSEAKSRLEYEVLQREQKSFEQGKKDLAELDSKTIPPDELFSKDTKVVKEIKLLEDTAIKYGVDLKLSISGTVKTAPKVPGVSGELFLVPYTVVLEGSFDGLINYIQSSEHLPFVTYTKVVTVDSIPDNKIRMTLNSDFFIRK